MWKRFVPTAEPFVPSSTRPHVHAFATALALAAIGAVFVFRYGSRVTPLAWVAALVFGVVYVAVIVGTRRVAPGVMPRALAAALVLGTLALALVSPTESGVVRLLALDVWLERVTGGHFPYGSPVRPSGFPGLFLLVAPLWSVGMLPLLPVAGLLVFLATVYHVRPERTLAVLAGLALLPSFYYEVVVHSELFFNASLALGSLWVFERARRHGWAALLAAGALAGLLLSTRLFVGVVYAVYGAYAFRSAWARGAAFAAIALAVWAATWVPFAVWDPERFAAFGPFAIQGLYLPGWATAGGALAALVLGGRAPDLPAVVARTGWLLLGLVVLSFGIAVLHRASAPTFFAGFDVAYFILPTPFLLLALGWAGARPRAPLHPRPLPSCFTSLTSPSPSAGSSCSTS